MAYYECVYLARQDIASTQVDALNEAFAETITTGGGSVTKTEYWGLRNLAYRVNKNRKAHFVLLNIDAPSDAVLEMRRLMRLNDDVLRELTLRVDELEEEPSVMMQRREERRDRGDRGDRGDRPPRNDDGPAPVKATAEKADAPKADTPVADAKAADTDAPKVDAPVTDAKAADTDAPKADAPVADAPVADAKAADTETPVKTEGES